MRSFLALLRREIWEHTTLRGLPLGLLIFFLLANLAVSAAVLRFDDSLDITVDGGTLTLGEVIGRFVQQPAEQQMAVINGTLITIGFVINSIILIMMFFYLLDSLYGERRDHSILFWKSLPVTDTATVLSKLTIAILVIPLTILATTMLAQIMTLAAQGLLTLRDHPGALESLWQNARLGSLWHMIFFLLLQQTIWYFPVMGWLLFCSAWSRRAPILAAVLIPAALVFIDSSFMLRTGASEVLLERLPLGIASMQIDEDRQLLNYRLDGDEHRFDLQLQEGIMRPHHESTLRFIANPRVWVGLLLGALFTALAVWLRRWRDDSL